MAAVAGGSAGFAEGVLKPDGKNNSYPLVNVYSLLLKMAIYDSFMVDIPSQNGDFP